MTLAGAWALCATVWAGAELTSPVEAGPLVDAVRLCVESASDLPEWPDRVTYEPGDPVDDDSYWLGVLGLVMEQEQSDQAHVVKAMVAAGFPRLAAAVVAQTLTG